MLALLGLTLLLTSLLKTYSVVPPTELKRRARAGDQLAIALYKVAGYGYSPKVLLQILVILSAAGFFVTASARFSPPVALLLVALVLWIGFIWLPTAKVSGLSARLAAMVAPGLAWLLERLHPLIDASVAFVHRHRPIRIHTGLYAKDDLVDLLQRQQVQADNRIEAAELQIAEHALQFGDKFVSDIMIPRRAVDAISAHEPIGPILMTELHKSGHSRFPVYDDSKDNLVGILYLREVTATIKTGTVQDLMHADHIRFIHEDQPLTEALQAIIRTQRQMLIVVNSFEEYVGIVTFEDIIEQILGQAVVDEFDRYDDIRAVAAKTAASEHKTRIDEQTEVVQ